MSKAKFENISGQTFNWLTAVRLDRWQPGKGFYWWWRCACGKEKSIRLIHVTSGHTKSCGCKRKSTKRNFPQPCAKCGAVHERRTAKGGYAKLCQTCFNKQQNHSAVPTKYLLARARDRANKFEIPFDLFEKDIVIPEFCPILGIKLTYGGIGERESSPTLDRLRGDLGYVRGNVSVISFKANRIKNNGTADEHRRIADWMDAQTKEAANAELAA
jgi:hypothetical protein